MQNINNDCTRKVSILIPCYNMGKYIGRLFDSLLIQTWPNMEVIIVDDGSKDNSKQVIDDYQSRFDEKGIDYKYIYQDNKGISGAIKTGLQYVSGDFLVWPDADDYYADPYSIEKLTCCLIESEPEVGIVRSQLNILDEDTLGLIEVKGCNMKELEPKTIFEDCLLGSNGYFYSPGAVMIDFQKFRELTNLEIHTSKLIGQNWQLLLPMYYSYRCKSILEPLHNVLARRNSDSRQERPYKDLKKRHEEFCVAQVETLKRISQMPETVRTAYITKVTDYYNRGRMVTAFFAEEKSDFLGHYSYCKARKMLTKRDKLMRLMIALPFGRKQILFVWHFLRNIKIL